MSTSNKFDKILFISTTLSYINIYLSLAKIPCTPVQEIQLKKDRGKSYLLNWNAFSKSERYYVEIHDIANQSKQEFLTSGSSGSLSIRQIKKGEHEVNILPFSQGIIWFHRCIAKNFTIGILEQMMS
ncbi:unnamed protein product [Gordionus sp. m RMFG-2023]